MEVWTPGAPLVSGEVEGSISLFVDCIPFDLTPSWLITFFEGVGRVDDVFLSKNARNFTKDAFGFVRFRRLQDARRAIETLDGFEVRGRRLNASMARYQIGGSRFENKPVRQGAGYRRIVNPSFRDHRKYAEVLKDNQLLVPDENRNNNIIPIYFTLNSSENKEVVQMLDHAVIAENSGVIHIAQSTSEVAAISKSIKGMFSLSPPPNF